MHYTFMMIITVELLREVLIQQTKWLMSINLILMHEENKKMNCLMRREFMMIITVDLLEEVLI